MIDLTNDGPPVPAPGAGVAPGLIDRPLRVRVAAPMIGVSTKTLLRYIASGKIAATQLPSGHWRISESAVHACRARHHRGNEAG